MMGEEEDSVPEGNADPSPVFPVASQSPSLSPVPCEFPGLDESEVWE